MFLPFWLLPYTCALAFCEGLLTPAQPGMTMKEFLLRASAAALGITYERLIADFNTPLPGQSGLPAGAFAEAVTSRCDILPFGTERA